MEYIIITSAFYLDFMPRKTCIHLDEAFINGFSGDVCNVRATGCTSCENNGTCVFIDGEFKCDCHSNYTGLRCEKTKSACELGQLKCQHGGQCYTDENGSARCHCPLKYTGRICEHRTTFCDLLLCKNGATCVEEKNGGGKCICKTGYTGENCEHTNPCHMLNPCEGPNSECVDTGNGDFTCRCMLGWTGYLCSVDINECVLNGSNPCGHGSCLNLPGHFECNCPKGLTGDRCEIDIDECLNDDQHNLCKNGGQCQNTFGGYECNCLQGFTGDNCQLLSMQECSNRLYCEQHQLDGKCDLKCNNEACKFDGGDCSLPASTDNKVRHQLVCLVTVDIPIKRGRKLNDHSARTQLLQYTSKLLNTDVYYLDKNDATGDQIPSKPCSRDSDGANYDCVQTTLSVTFPKCNPSTVLPEEICFNSTDQITRFVSVQLNNTGHRYKTMIKENSDYIIRNVEAYVQERPNNIQSRQQWLSDMMDNGDSQIAIVIIIIIISLLIIVAFVWFINIRGRKLIKINPDTVLRLIDEHHYGIKDGIQKYLNKFQESSNRKRKLSFDGKISDNKKLLSKNSLNSNSENSSVTQDPIFYDIPFKKYAKVYKESSNIAIFRPQDDRNKSRNDQHFQSVSSPSNLIHLLTRENISPEQRIKAIEEQLISKDSKIPTYSSGETILHLSIRFNQIDVLKYFIDKYPEMLQVRDSYGRTVLHSACLRCPGNNEILYMLANRNDVDVDSFDNEGMTPLHHAISLNYNDVALLLMNANAKIDLRQDGESGNTALHYAAQVNNINAIVCLIEKGATIDSLNFRRQTPMYLATVEGNNEAASTLLSHGASPNITDSSGRDMLTVAMLKRNEPLVTMFRRVLIACQVAGQNKPDVIRAYEKSKRKRTKVQRQTAREIKSTSTSKGGLHDENKSDHLKLKQHINQTMSMQSNGLYYHDNGGNANSCNGTSDIPILTPIGSCVSDTFVNHSMMASGPEYFDSCVHPDYKRVKFDNCIKSGIRTVHDKSSNLATNLVYHQMMPPDLRSTFQCQESYRRNPLMCYNQYIPVNAHHCHHQCRSINYSVLKDRSFAFGGPGCCAPLSQHHNHLCNSYTTVNHMSQFCVNTPCGHIAETNIVQHNSPEVVDPYLFQVNCQANDENLQDILPSQNSYPGFSGDVCNVRATGCTSCENNGTCVFIDGEFKCDCHSNYTGLRCEKTKSACELGQLKCQHGGQCYTDENGSARCHCPLKYTGRICEHRTTFCDLLLCKNGATCVEEKNGGGKCICKTGYTGENCEHTNPCHMLNPCEGPNSECVDTGNGDFTCRCMLGWTGYLCSVDINECVLNGSNPCGHGSCLNLPGHFECNCPKGLTGDRCEIDIDECLNDDQHNLCKNGGQCQNTFGGYECNCLQGFTGDNCQLLSMQECSNRLYCEQHQLDGKCDLKCNNEACKFDGGDCSLPASTDNKVRHQLVCLVTVDIPIKRGRKLNDHSARTQLLQYTSKLLNTDVYYLDKNDATGDQIPSKPCSRDSDGANYDCVQTTLSVTFPKCNPSTVLPEEICFNSTDQITRFVSVQLNNTGHRYKTMIKENSDYIIRNVEAYVQERPNNIQSRQQWLSDMMDNGDSQIAIVIIIIIISLLIIVAFVWFINIRGRKLIKINPDTVLRLIDEHHYGIKDGIQKYLNKFQESSNRKRKLSFDGKISDNKKLLSKNSLNSNSENSSVTQDPIFYDIPFKKYAKLLFTPIREAESDFIMTFSFAFITCLHP
ncbi:hypothetical protein GJ496_000186 [Pomphorhynchus laevis]|nr:hypothetical protein GJ496_000186 [Pomphorhynchus laevis]